METLQQVDGYEYKVVQPGQLVSIVTKSMSPAK